VQSCMGCPLLVSLTVAAIRKRSTRALGDDLMVPSLVPIWRDVNDNFLRTASLIQAKGAAGITYELKVRQVYAASVQCAKDACSEQGLDKQTFEVLLQVLRMFPAGQWIPAAALKVIVSALTDNLIGSVAANCTDEVLDLLEEFSIITQMTQSVYKHNGVSSIRRQTAGLYPMDLACKFKSEGMSGTGHMPQCGAVQ
jgi:hypothetical protein